MTKFVAPQHPTGSHETTVPAPVVVDGGAAAAVAAMTLIWMLGLLILSSYQTGIVSCRTLDASQSKPIRWRGLSIISLRVGS